MSISAMTSSVQRRIQEKEALGVGVILGSTAAFAAINVYKSNTSQGVYNIFQKSDGTGGVPLDATAGVLLAIAGLAVPAAKGGSWLLALGVGGLVNWGARFAAQKALNAKINAGATTTTSTSGSLSGFYPYRRTPEYAAQIAARRPGAKDYVQQPRSYAAA